MDIVGMDSAVLHAKELPDFANMKIPASLVVDMAEEIARLRAELEAALVDAELYRCIKAMILDAARGGK